MLTTHCSLKLEDLFMIAYNSNFCLGDSILDVMKLVSQVERTAVAKVCILHYTTFIFQSFTVNNHHLGYLGNLVKHTFSHTTLLSRKQ